MNVYVGSDPGGDDVTIEQKYAESLVSAPGSSQAQMLATDAYKNAMAQAGYPLRNEVFQLVLRKGGPFYIPFDFAEVVRYLRPNMTRTEGHDNFLRQHGFDLTDAMFTALKDGALKVTAAPKGSWIFAGEPVLTVEGPSYLVSWLEPLILMFHFPIQLATALKNGKTGALETTCDAERDIILYVETEVGVSFAEKVIKDTSYLRQAERNILAAIEAVGGDVDRIFEVGFRAATCTEQHLRVLSTCRALGVMKTSNMLGAFIFGMTPVGTTGHEHPQREGDDLTALRNMRDRRSGRPTSLPDAYDTLRLGIPATIAFWKESGRKDNAVRFDSGDQKQQVQLFRGFELMDPGFEPPTYLFEDGYTAEKIVEMEAYCDSLGIPPDRCIYGLGGFFVSAPSTIGFQRDDVSAAYKLCFSLRPTMKFSGSVGKRSIPGRPVIMRSTGDAAATSIVAQAGEHIHGYAVLSGEAAMADTRKPVGGLCFSEKTLALVEGLTAELDQKTRLP